MPSIRDRRGLEAIQIETNDEILGYPEIAGSKRSRPLDFYLPSVWERRDWQKEVFNQALSQYKNYDEEKNHQRQPLFNVLWLELWTDEDGYHYIKPNKTLLNEMLHASLTENISGKVNCARAFLELTNVENDLKTQGKVLRRVHFRPIFFDYLQDCLWRMRFEKHHLNPFYRLSQ